MTAASQRQRPPSSPHAECVFVEDSLRTRSVRAQRFNWSQMLAVVQLSTSLQKQELLNRPQFAGDRNWQVETRVTPEFRFRLLPRDKWPRKLDKGARPLRASAAARASPPALRGSNQGRFPGTRRARDRGESRDTRASRGRIRAAL